MNAQATAERFLTASYSGDIQGARDATTKDFTLLGPFPSVHNAEELLDLGAGLMRIASDFAIAFADEIQTPAHHRTRFTVGY
jgi:hypothetical protein